MESNEQDNRQLTVLAELKNFVSDLQKTIVWGYSNSHGLDEAYGRVLTEIKSLLPKEKEVLIKTKENELLHFCNPDAAKQMAEDWFNQTFKQG